MTLNKTLPTLALTLLLLPALIGCDKEPLCCNETPEINLFVPDDTDASTDATLRRSFYDATGAYLLFSDTLRRGDRSRILNIPYNVTITGSDYYEAQLYRLKYLTDADQQAQAADFVRNRIAKYVSKRAMPYSVLLVDTIIAYPYNKSLKSYDMAKPDTKQITVFGMQTLAIARLGDLAHQSEAQQNSLAVEILNNMVKEAMAHTNDALLAPFYAISEAYYDKSFSKEEGNLPNVKDQRELGFIKCYRFKPDNMSFYPAKRDLEVFVKEILGKSQEKWSSEYAAYPLVLRKLEILKSIIEQRGISLEYLTK